MIDVFGLINKIAQIHQSFYKSKKQNFVILNTRWSNIIILPSGR
jgi:hypothetical protein